MKIRFALASLLAVTSLSVAMPALAATPTLSISGTGGDSVQLTVTGDPNANATLFYNIGSQYGASTYVLGTTDASGQLTKTISVSGIGLNTGNSVYVIVNGQQSATQPWNASAGGGAAAPVLSQTSVLVNVGQSAVVTLQGALNSVYVLSSTNSAVAIISPSGAQINVTGSQVGATAAVLCYNGTTTNCATLNVTVQSAGTGGTTSGSVTFDQPNPVVPVGGMLTIKIIGGNAFYVSTNSNPSIMTYRLNDNVITITGVSNGSALLSICSLTGSCGQLSVTVGPATGTTTTAGQGVGFNPTSSTVVVGQTVTVILSGSTAYFVSINSNPIAVQTGISGNMLSITGVVAGSTSLTVCAAGGTNCGTLPVTVTTTAPVTPAPVTVPTPTIPTVTTTTNSGSLLATVQIMQSQLAQMLLAIQAMQAQLKQLVASTPTVSSAPSVSASFGGSFTSFMGMDSTGSEVTALQKKLASEGFYSGPITGTFGPLTEAAVKKFQSAHGIDPAGYVGPSTRAALNQ